MKDALLSSTTAAGKPIEIWFQDEARVGQKGTHAYVWAPVGSCPLMVKDNRHDPVHLFGAICPARGVGAAIIMPAVNIEAMNEHLKEISSQVTADAHAVLILDGRREVFPSIAMISGSSSRRSLTQARKQDLNKSGSSAANTSHSVSWIGMPD